MVTHIKKLDGTSSRDKTRTRYGAHVVCVSVSSTVKRFRYIAYKNACCDQQNSSNNPSIWIIVFELSGFRCILRNKLKPVQKNTNRNSNIFRGRGCVTLVDWNFDVHVHLFFLSSSFLFFLYQKTNCALIRLSDEFLVFVSLVVPSVFHLCPTLWSLVKENIYSVI